MLAATLITGLPGAGKSRLIEAWREAAHPQKAIAVSRAGASLFLVPSVELGPARSTASSSLHVAAVNDLNQAISILFDHGGTLTMANGTVEGKPHTVAKS